LSFAILIVGVVGKKGIEPIEASRGTQRHKQI